MQCNVTSTVSKLAEKETRIIVEHLWRAKLLVLCVETKSFYLF